MAGESPNGNGGFSQKEWLVRIDSKVESLTQTVAAKHATYDVEIALLKARTEDLEKSERERDADLRETNAKQDALTTRINVAAGAIALVVFLAPIIWILVNKLVN